MAVGAGFVVYMLYCYVQEWRAKRRFERIRRESREKAQAKPPPESEH
jgi:uncharacterized membrane-anchored protein